VGTTRSEAGSSALERAAYTIPEFCFRNNISRPTYHRLRSEGRGPLEMRIGLNAIRITAEAERDWQRSMQEPREDLETRAAARAVKAGDAAVKSSKHVSKKRRDGSKYRPKKHSVNSDLQHKQLQKKA
jgi:hypothetical protein